MTSIIRAQNQIVRLIRGSNGRIKRPLSVSCVSSNLDDFHKHRRKQKIMEEISEDAKKNFDSRTGKFLRIPPTMGEMARKIFGFLSARDIIEKLAKEAQIQADYMKQQRKNAQPSPLKNWIKIWKTPVKNSYDWIKKTWLPKSKFRFFIIGPIVIILLSCTTLGPVYVYGHVKKILTGDDSDTVYWENPNYKNPIVGNPEKAERKDWVFHDTPKQRLLRCIGLGSDWMTQLPIEERIQFWEWPWVDWWMYDLLPMPHNQREYDIPTSYITNPQFKVTKNEIELK